MFSIAITESQWPAWTKIINMFKEKMSLFSFSSLQTNLTGFDDWEVYITKYR